MSVVAHTTVVKLHLLLKIQRFVSGIYILTHIGLWKYKGTCISYALICL